MFVVFDPVDRERFQRQSHRAQFGCRENSRELQTFYDGGPGDWADVIQLSNLLATGNGRKKNADITLFKWMGVGLADVAAGVEILRRAKEQGIGSQLPHPGRAAPDLS